MVEGGGDQVVVVETIVETVTVSKRGTTNGNARGNAEDRRKRRAWLMVTYASDIEGFVRCYRCGDLLYNEDDPPRIAFTDPVQWVTYDCLTYVVATPITVDRIIPGCHGGTYRRTNIRPACAGCNSETGGRLSGTSKRGKR